MQFRKLLIAVFLLGLILVCGCESTESPRDKGNKKNQELMEKAVKTVPTPNVDNFLTRKYVAKWMKRQDTPQKSHYVYIFGDNGNVVGYYVSQNRPINLCSFMTPPEKVVERVGQDKVVSAPALDGVYYGDGACNQWHFFDSATDAMIEMSGFKFITSDQPLKIDAEPIEIE